MIDIEELIERLRSFGDAEPHSVRLMAADLMADYRKKLGHITELEQENERLQEICAAAYQMAGSAGAPVRFLDALSRPCETTQEQIDALLPVRMDEFDRVQ